MVNLETPVSSEETASTGELVSNVPPSLSLHSLKANGVSVATFANNHSLDQGPEGIVETRQNLALTGLRPRGASVSESEAWRPLRFERRGLRCAVLAMTRWLSRYPPTWAPAAPHVPFVPYSWDRSQRGTSVFEALERVHAIASTVDVLIVAIHWETNTRPSPRAMTARSRGRWRTPVRCSSSATTRTCCSLSRYSGASMVRRRSSPSRWGISSRIRGWGTTRASSATGCC